MAKATSKEKGTSARSRIPRASLTADTDSPTAVEDEPSENEVEMAVDRDDTAGDDDESFRLDPTTLRTGDSAALAVTARPASRKFTLPEPILRVWGARFIYESALELRKVTWPTRAEAWNMTLVVLAMSAVVALILGVSDIVLTHALTWLLGLGG